MCVVVFCFGDRRHPPFFFCPRAGVERVMGWADDAQVAAFFKDVVWLEESLQVRGVRGAWAGELGDEPGKGAALT